MADLEFYEKHNMVAFLKKPTKGEGFQEMVDFLNGSLIKYVLTKNPTIYVSIIKQFWQTATVRAVDNGEQQIIATVDGEQTPLFPTMLAKQANEGKGSGHPFEPQAPSFSAQPIHEEQILTITSVPILNVPNEAICKEWDDSVERATTTAASLDATQDSGNILKTQSTAMPNVPLPQGIGTGGSPRC
nr:hypothetical protein [Tanacetum cinerariifolium]